MNASEKTPKKKPIIGLNCDGFSDANGVITGLRESYWQAIERAGGIPLMIPHLTERAALEQVLELMDGVVLVGGDDLSARKLSELSGREIAASPHNTTMPELRQ